MEPGRVHTDDLYDLAYGPPSPRVYRRVPEEWDGPTWIEVIVEREFMAAQLARIERGKAELARMARRVEFARQRAELAREAREERRRRATWPTPAPSRRRREKALLEHRAQIAGVPFNEYVRRYGASDTSQDVVLAALVAGPATAPDVQAATGLTSYRTTRTLRWLTMLGDVRRATWPGSNTIFYRLATLEASRIWNAMTIDAREQIARAESTGRWGGRRGRVETDQTGPETASVSPRLRPSARRAVRRPQSDVTPTDVTLAGINAALDAGPATTAIVAATTGFTTNRVLNGLRWLTQVGEVRSDQHPATEAGGRPPTAIRRRAGRKRRLAAPNTSSHS